MKTYNVSCSISMDYEIEADSAQEAIRQAVSAFLMDYKNFVVDTKVTEIAKSNSKGEELTMDNKCFTIEKNPKCFIEKHNKFMLTVLKHYPGVAVTAEDEDTITVEALTFDAADFIAYMRDCDMIYIR